MWSGLYRCSTGVLCFSLCGCCCTLCPPSTITIRRRTSDLIPLCHPLPLEKVTVDVVLEGSTAIVEFECRVTSKTGVEMEALTGATIAALTIYDMVKAVSHRVTIQETVLVSKTGGKRQVGPTDEE